MGVVENGGLPNKLSEKEKMGFEIYVFTARYIVRLAAFPHFPREREMDLRENSRGKQGAGNCGENWPILA